MQQTLNRMPQCTFDKYCRWLTFKDFICVRGCFDIAAFQLHTLVWCADAAAATAIALELEACSSCLLWALDGSTASRTALTWLLAVPLLAHPALRGMPKPVSSRHAGWC